MLARIREAFRAWRDHCRTCEVTAIAGSLIDQIPQLTPVEPLKFGHLYRCSKCDRWWFLDDDKHWLHRIDDERLPRVREWHTRSLTANDSLLRVLASIGGTEDQYRGHIAVPCSVQDVNERHHEKSLVLVSKQPPLGWCEPQAFHWADEMAAVSPSVFALPLEVRRASAEQREESMGFAPVGLVDPRGTEYTLGCAGHFFDHNGIRGDQIRLSGRRKRWRNIVPPEPPAAYFLVDWFDGCNELLTRPAG
jgi:hypothetical protein